MKVNRLLSTISVTLLFLNALGQNTLNISSGHLSFPPSDEPPQRTIEYEDGAVIITYKFPSLTELTFPGTDEMLWSLPGFATYPVEGYPAIPMRNDVFTSDGKVVSKVELIDENHYNYEGVLLPASAPSYSDNEAQRVEIADYEGMFPTAPVSISRREEYRGNEVCYIFVSPVQYDYSKSLLKAYTMLKYKVTYTEPPTAFANGPKRIKGINHTNPFLNPFSFAIPLQEESASTMRRAPGDITSVPEGYLIITTVNLLPAANKLAHWKRALGYNVVVKSSLRAWESKKIESAIKEFYYNTANPMYVLLLGSANLIKPKTFVSQYQNEVFVTDYYYACLGGSDDLLADLYRGRIPADNLEEANCVVDKIINYEMNPPKLKDYYRNATHLSHFEDSNNDGKADNLFVNTSENILNHLENYEGMKIQRMYTKSATCTKPLKFGRSINGIYTSSSYKDLPACLLDSNFRWNYDGVQLSTIANLWNNNRNMYILYVAHGVNYKWGNPPFLTEEIYRLKNVINPPFVYSFACQTGGFEKDPCFSARLLLEPGAALNVIACSPPTWLGYQDALAEATFNCLFPDNKWIHYYSISSDENKIALEDKIDQRWYMPVAAALEYGVNYVEQWLTNGGEILSTSKTKYLLDQRLGFHNFGDPSLVMRTKCPDYVLGEFSRDDSLIYYKNLDDYYTVTFYNTLTGEIKKYFRIKEAAYEGEDAGYVIGTITGSDRIPFVDVGEKVQVNIFPSSN